MLIVEIGDNDDELLRDEGDPEVQQPTTRKRVVIGAGARALFYPTLLYNVIRCNFEGGFNWWDQVDEGLILGAVPFHRHVLLLKELGVTGVVTLNEPFETLVTPKFYKDHGIDQCIISTRDYYYAPSLKQIKRGVRFIREHVMRNAKTYVHCKAGRGRSTTVVLCYLIKYRGMNPLEAFEYVRASRPRIKLASSQWKAVWEFTRKCCPSRLVNRCESEACEEEEPVIVSELDLVGYTKADNRWLLLGLVQVLTAKLSCILRIKHEQPLAFKVDSGGQLAIEAC